MAFPVAWAVGSFIGGLLAKGIYDEVFADSYDEDEEEKEAAGYSDDVLTALFDKLQKAGDAKGLYDFGCILENEDEEWAKKFFEAAADMNFAIAKNKLRTMEE
ncbi:MAG: hypothetical protein DBY32_08115 [Phascolarctobacterium sp.]|nr:MAG: hypothetical protein DBY32_08115 [Phascolarctobacterium sp.]